MKENMHQKTCRARRRIFALFLSLVLAAGSLPLTASPLQAAVKEGETDGIQELNSDGSDIQEPEQPPAESDIQSTGSAAGARSVDSDSGTITELKTTTNENLITNGSLSYEWTRSNYTLTITGNVTLKSPSDKGVLLLGELPWVKNGYSASIKTVDIQAEMAGEFPNHFFDNGYNNNTELLNKYTMLESITKIPDGITSIGAYAFSDCRKLESVTIPDSVTTIGRMAFIGCEALTSVTIPGKVTTIDVGAFSGCHKLKSVTIPDSVTTIGMAAFTGCYGLTSVAMPCVTALGTNAFEDCYGLTSVEIPKVEGTIGFATFASCKALKSVTIPEGVKGIGALAFDSCEALTSVEIPDGVTTIGSAFENCTALTSVEIPASVTTIGPGTFYNCSALEKVVLNSENPPALLVDGSNPSSTFFNGCSFVANRTKGIIVPKGSLATYQEAENWQSWSDYMKEADTGDSQGTAFDLKDVNGNSFIEKGALYYTWDETSKCLTITGDATLRPASEGEELSRQELPWVSGGYSDTIVTVNIQANMRGEFPNHFFDDWYENSSTSYSYLYSALKNINIPEGITSIGESALAHINIESVTIPDSVTTIGHEAFWGCNKLTSVTIPDGVTEIGAQAFLSCDELTSVTIPDSVITIGKGAFNSCGKLASVKIPDSVTAIDDKTFWGCARLTSVEMPGVTTIGDEAFENCRQLSSVEMPKLKTIGDEAFYYCWSLESVTMPSVTKIGKSAFARCTVLTNVTIPDSVTTIGVGAFLSSGLEKIVLNSKNPPELGDRAFEECKFVKNKTKGIIVPKGSLAAYQAAKNWQSWSDYMEEAGAGEIDSPYPIADKAALESLRDRVNAGEDFTGVYFLITQDIDLGGGSWTPIGTPEHPFNGNLDGGGHTVQGVSVSNAQEDNQGLFGVNAGTIKNLTVEGSVTGRNNVGGVAGSNKGTGTIQNCTSSVTVNGQSNVGGIAGENDGTIDGCINAGLVNGGENTGGIAGTNGADGKVRDCTSSGNVTGENPSATGAVIGKNENTNDNDITGNYYRKTDEINKDLTAIGGRDEDPAGTTSGDGSEPADGSGTEDDPYRIASKEDLERLLREEGASKGKYYKITKDIDLEGSAENQWTPLPNFQGTLDGNNRTIKGLYIAFKDGGRHQGLFVSNAGTIRNLTVEGEITAEFYVGGIAGRNSYNATSYSDYGVAVIEGCTSRVDITAVDAAGGIVGSNGGIIQGCRNEGNITGVKDRGVVSTGNLPEGIGGIAGKMNLDGAIYPCEKIIDCINNGEIYRDEAGTNGGDKASYSGGVGGIVGVQGSSIVPDSLKGNINNGNVTGCKWVGGIVGRSNGPVQDNTNNGTVTGIGDSYRYQWGTGGISGIHDYPAGGGISHLFSGNNNNGKVINVSGDGYVIFGGVIGWVYRDESMKLYQDNYFRKTEDFNQSLRAIGQPTGGWMTEYNTASESIYKLPNPGEPFRGEGTAEAPYIISGTEELESLREAVNAGNEAYSTAHFEIVQDIDLAGSAENPWTPIGTTEHPFKGTLNGGGHTVSGLYINDETKDDQGLFGVNAGTIENLRAEGAVTGKDNAGGIAGTNTASGVIKGCVADVTVTGNDYVGGIAGKNEGKIESCTSYGSITGNDYVGGIAGSNEASGTITDGVNNGNVSKKEGSAGTHIGGVAGDNKNTNSGSVTGGYVKNDETNKDIFGIGGKTEEESGIKANENPLPEAGEVFPGRGTAKQPYQIYTPEDMQTLQQEIAEKPDVYKNVHFELRKDVTFPDGSSQTPIGTDEKPFEGIFHGNGHSIKGLNVSDAAKDNQGLFGANAGTIENLTVEGSVTGKDNVGGIVGINKPSGIIKDCIGNAKVEGQNNVGGIVGKNEGIIRDSASNADKVSGTDSVGGIAGSNTGSIKDSIGNSEVSGTNNVGGIAGSNEGEIVRCVTKADGGSGTADKGSVTGTGTGTGGIAGNNTGSIKDSTNNAEVTGGSGETGGVAGTNGTGGTVNNGGNNGNVTSSESGGDGTTTGALVGKNENEAGDSVSGSYKKNDDVNKDLTGIGGEEDTDSIKAVTDGKDVENPQKPFKGSGTEEDPYQIETEDDLKKLADLVNGGENHEGEHYKITSPDGITLTDKNKPWTPIGTEDHPFKGSFDGDHKTVSGLTTTEGSDNQGLFGVNDGTIENLTVEGSVTGKDKVGGIAGSNTENGTIQNCTSSVTVNGESNVGGIAGENQGTITGCTNKGTVSGTVSNTGGITGHNGETGRVKDNINSENVTGSESNDTIGAVIGKNDNSTGKGTDISGNYYKKTDEVNSNLKGTGGDNASWDSDEGHTSGKNATPGEPFEGSGERENPYFISSIEDLENLRDNVNGGNTYDGKHFKVTENISLGGEDSPWTPIGTEKYPFEGTILGDGEGKTISGLYIDDEAGDNQGLFGFNAGTIENLTVEGSVIGKDCVGGIAGTNMKGGKIKDCTADVSVNGHDNVGGIAGKNEGTITGCTNKGSVTGTGTGTGGITGTNGADGILRDNTNNGNVTGEDKQTTGAVIGKNENADPDSEDIEGNYYQKTDTINTGLTGIGGESQDRDGISSGTDPVPERHFKESGTENDPYLIKYLSDLIALRDGVNGGNTYKDKYFKVIADINLWGDTWTPIGTKDDPFEGTILGDGEGKTISGLYIDDEVGDNQGLFGFNAGTIENLTVVGSVTGKDCVGGIAGTNMKGGKIKDCTADVSVNGHDNVGGIAGKNDGTITGCTNKRSVTGTGTGIGGITGTNGADGTVEGCTNSGDVRDLGDGTPKAGAIIGNNQNTDLDAVKDDYYQKTDSINQGLPGIGEGTGAGMELAGITSGQTPTNPGKNPAGTDQAVAKDFEDDKIAAIERANPVGGTAWKQAVRDAAEAFEKLTDAQRELVSAYAKKILADAEAILAAVEKIEAIGTVTNTAECGQKIKAARDAYDKLTSEQKAKIPEGTEKILTDAESAYAALQKGSQDNNQGGSQNGNQGGSQNNNQGGSQNGGGNLTQEQKQQIQTIAKELGVSEETAAKIQAAAEELGVSVDTLLMNDDTILKQKSEDDVKGSTFARLQAKASKVTKTSVKVTWKKVKGADGYLVYGAKCGLKNPYKLLATVKKSGASYTQKKLKKGSQYKYIVRAYKLVDGKKITIAASKTVHVHTLGGKYGNPKSVTVSKTKAYLVKGKSLKVKGSLVKGGKKLKRHRSVWVFYESSDTKVATVTNKGVIKAKANGTCTIYAYAQNGVYKAIKVTVVGKAKKSTSIKLNKKTYSMKKGASYTLKPTVKPATSTDTVRWSSSDKKVATVDAYGTVKAKKKGTATITATTTSGKKATCKITVK